MNDRPVIFVATDIITSIAEGDVSIVNNLQRRRYEYDEIVLLSSVLAEGIKKSVNSTVEGMHAIARLIGLSRIDNIVHEGEEFDEADGEGLQRGFIPFQFFLKYILDPNAENVLTNMLVESDPEFSGFETSHAQIATALLCLRKGDNLNTKAFGLLIKKLHINMGNGEHSNLHELYLPEEFIKKVRTEVLGED